MLPDDMRGILEQKQRELQDVRARAGFLEAWVKLQGTIMWQAIETELAKLEGIAKDTCVDVTATESVWQQSAAEARVYRWLRMRPERAEREIVDMRSRIEPLEAEIGKLKNVVKGA